MPKAPRNQEEVNAVREKILDTALHIITSDGFQNLSMRKIASRMGISATTIYNYYKNIDDLYFNIRIHGFDLLHESFEEALRRHRSPRERLVDMIKRYARFGIEYPDYYDVMYVNPSVPKYREVVGTELESIAYTEKETALKPFVLVVETIRDLCADEPGFMDSDVLYRGIRLWCELNGIISLHNSRLLHEVEEDVDGLVDRLVGDICARFGE